MKTLTLIIISMVVVHLYGYTEEVEYEEDIHVAPTECLQLQGSNRGFGGSYQLRFYNACPKEIWASICVEERRDKFKLHESASKIPKYGYLSIYTYESSAPLSIEWRSSAGRPDAPGHCGIH